MADPGNSALHTLLGAVRLSHSNHAPPWPRPGCSESAATRERVKSQLMLLFDLSKDKLLTRNVLHARYSPSFSSLVLAVGGHCQQQKEDDGPCVDIWSIVRWPEEIDRCSRLLSISATEIDRPPSLGKHHTHHILQNSKPNSYAFLGNLQHWWSKCETGEDLCLSFMQYPLNEDHCRPTSNRDQKGNSGGRKRERERETVCVYWNIWNNVGCRLKPCIDMHYSKGTDITCKKLSKDDLEKSSFAATNIWGK